MRSLNMIGDRPLKPKPIVPGDPGADTVPSLSAPQIPTGKADRGLTPAERHAALFPINLIKPVPIGASYTPANVDLIGTPLKPHDKTLDQTLIKKNRNEARNAGRDAAASQRMRGLINSGMLKDRPMSGLEFITSANVHPTRSNPVTTTLVDDAPPVNLTANLTGLNSIPASVAAKVLLAAPAKPFGVSTGNMGVVPTTRDDSVTAENAVKEAQADAVTPASKKPSTWLTLAGVLIVIFLVWKGGR